MKVGFHVEGRDHLIFKAILAKILSIPMDSIEADWIDPHGDAVGRGNNFILKLLPDALVRFYKGKKCNMAVVGIDNDGNCDIQLKGLIEDPFKPRHWNHEGSFHSLCKRCQIKAIVEEVRVSSDISKSLCGGDWPVIIAVPVEQIESWLLTIRAIINGNSDELSAENQARRDQKFRFYGKHHAGKRDIRRRSLPMINDLTGDHISMLKQFSRSFADFADQVESAREAILNS